VKREGPEFDVREYYEKIPALLCILDSENYIFHPNGAWERVTGIPLDELHGTRLDDRLHPDDRDPARRTSRISVEAQGAIVQESRFLCADGSYRWIEWTMRVSLERGLVYCCARGIEQPRRATVTAARRLDTYLRRAPVAMIESELGRGITEWSSGAERLFGYKRSEAIGRKLPDLVVPEAQRQEVLDAVYAIRDGQLQPGRSNVSRNLTKDGRTVLCEWHNAPLSDDDGHVRAILSIAVDRTEVEEERARADESLARFNMLMQGSKNGLWDFKPLDPTNPLDLDVPIFISEGLLRMLGRDRAPATLGEWIGVVHPEDAPMMGQRFHEHIAAQSTETDVEFRVVRADGAPLWVACTWYSRWNDNSELERFACSVLDISERKAAESDLRDKLAVIERQAEAIRELQTPILEVQEGVLCVPVVGVVDSRRAAEMMDAALGAVVGLQARFLILDLTGVPMLDTSTADRLLAIARAAGLVGARTVITGLRPAVAQTVVTLGVPMGDVKTLRNLKDGLRHCLQEARR
jgi:rsbT co-antagonist protein RsbR